MTKAFVQRTTALAVVSGAILCSSAALASIVYDNSSTSLNRSYAPDNGVEFGDEIFLAGADRTVTEFRFESFVSSNANGNENAQVIFRLNDGPLIGANRNAPGTELARSPAFALGGVARNTSETHIWSGISVPVADNFTWSMVFSGIDAGEQVGLVLYDPPTIGSSYDDFWQKSGATWDTFLIENGNVKANFGARITAIPEPGTLALWSLGGLTLLGYLGYRRRTA